MVPNNGTWTAIWNVLLHGLRLRKRHVPQFNQVAALDSRHVAAANLQPLFHNKVAPLYLFHRSPFFRSLSEFEFDSLLSFVCLLSSLTLVCVCLLLRPSIAAFGFNASAIHLVLATDLRFLGKFWISRVSIDKNYWYSKSYNPSKP
jgi:hypothetical protein